MSTETGRLWEVFYKDKTPGFLTYATSATEAKRQTKERYPDVTEIWPHRNECTCENLSEVCVKGELERCFKPTRLGKLCGL